MDHGDAEQHSTPSDYAAVEDTLIIRSFQRSDEKECQQIFRDGFQEFINTVVMAILSTSQWYVGMATVLTALAAVMWSTWIFVVFILTTFILSTFLYVILQFVGHKAINYVMISDLKDIEKTYMSDEDCHMWVAEWSGKVVAMVGLIHNKSDDHEPGVFELQRMYVAPHCRKMGIGKRMLIELITHAKKHRNIKMIILSTTITQKPAIQLYMKYGFKPRAVSSSAKKLDQLTTGRSIYRIVGAMLSFLAKHFTLQLELLTSSAKTS